MYKSKQSKMQINRKAPSLRSMLLLPQPQPPLPLAPAPAPFAALFLRLERLQRVRQHLARAVVPRIEREGVSCKRSLLHDGCIRSADQSIGFGRT
jgi:hypothetical protein